MNKQFVFFMIIFLALLGVTTNAYADTVCPAGSQKIVDEQTREVFCVAAPGAVQTNQQYYANKEYEVQRDNRKQFNRDRELEEIHQNIIDSGFEVQFGMGYGLMAAYELHLKLEFSFAQPTNGLSFGLFTNCDLFIGYPNSIDWAAGPVIHINGNRFRGGIGLGFGLFNVWEKHYFDSDEYYEDRKADSSIHFSMIPRVECDWFVSKHLYLGFGLDFPLIFYHHEKNEYDRDDNALSTETAMWFDMHLHVGYKF